MRFRARLWIALGLLLAWHVPVFASIGIGLHLSGDHPSGADHAGDHHTGDGQQERALELALVAAHGHHHELDAPPHDHSAVRIVVPTAPAPQVVTLVSALAASPPGELVGRAAPSKSPPRTAPPELFYRHCALRL